MNAHKKKEATLDSLAIMVQHGFEGIDRHFDEMNERFDQLEKIILHDHHDRIGRLEDQVNPLPDLKVGASGESGWRRVLLRRPFIFIRQLADSPFIRGLKTAAFRLGTSKRTSSRFS